jgi:predicted nucleic acid-binding protein
MEILDDPDCAFASSAFVRLEILPKPIFNKHPLEVEFYEAFFETVSAWAESNESMADLAYAEAVKAGLSAVDALHIAAALSVGAQELVTTEKPGKPIHRATSIPVRTIQPTG